MSNKTCSKCNLIKPISAFYTRKKAGLCVPRSQCITCLKEKRKIYCLDNKEKRKEYQQKYQPKATKRMRERYHTDLQFKLMRLYRSRVKDALKVAGEVGYSRRDGGNLLGCDWNTYKKHLEEMFTDGMNWNLFEKGEIHIDHILPCSLFDLSQDEARKKCFHYTNTRPLWKTDNLIKSKCVEKKHIHLIESNAQYIDINKLVMQQNVQ